MLSQLLYMRHKRIFPAPMCIQLDESPGWMQLAGVCLSAAEGLDPRRVQCLRVARRDSCLAFQWYFDDASLECRMQFGEITRWARDVSARLCWVCGDAYGNECDLHRWRI